MKINQVMPLLDEQELANITIPVQDKWLSEGPWAEKFLGGLKELSGSQYAVLAPNGTLGLYLAILALDLPLGSEILVPSFTFFGSASSIVFAGHKPVFVDVDMSDYSMNLEDLAAKISPRTSAIMGVHIYGQVAKLSELHAIAKQHNLMLIEDAAQAIGVTFDGIHAGTIGDVGVISFFADKTITTGEGAVVFCRDEKIWQKLKLLRNQGRPNSGTFIHEALGMNFRVTDLQAAIGFAQLQKLESIQAQRLKAYNRYQQKLKHVDAISFMQVDSRSSFIPFRFPLTTKYKDHLMRMLEAAGVQTRSFFYPMHLQPPLTQYANHEKPCVNAERLYETGIALPIHSQMTDEAIDFICTTIVSNL